MFERTFEEMTASVFVEAGAAGMAFQYGAAEVLPGSNNISSAEAVTLVRKLDRLQLSVPKRLTKRWRALRNQFAFAFGPEFEAHLDSSTE